MPNWKKLLSSGSSGSLSNLVVDNHISASLISGSFYGDGSGLTGVIADGTISGSSQVNITQTEGYSTFSSSIQTYTDAKVAGLVDSAPGTLDTLNELAAALGDDATFSASIATSIGNRVLTSTFNTYSGSAHTQREALKYTDSKVKTKLDAEGVISGSSQVSISGTTGYATFSASIDTHLDANISALSSSAHTDRVAKINILSSSVDTHLDANISALSGAAHTDRVAKVNVLSGSAHTQRVAIASLIPTNTNQLTNGAGFITSIDGAISGSSQVNITQTEGYSTFSSSVDAHLDANISSLSSSAHTQREAIKGLATTANNSLSSSIATAFRAEYVAADTALSSSQKTYIDQKVAGVVDSAPATLDTLNELAAALNDDPNFSASIATSIGNRVLTSTFNTYSGSAAGALRTEYKAGDSALSSSAHTQRVAIASSIPTNNNQLTNGAGYITGYTETDTFATVTSRGATSNSSVTINGLMIGGLGSQTTGGTTDWDNSTNARSGQGHSLLLGTHTNGPGTTNYYHPISFEYSSKNGSGNLTQFAIPYTGYNMYFRSRYSGTWAGWATMWNSGNDGAGSGLDADLWDGNQFASYLNQAVLTSSSPSFNQVILTNNGNGTNLRIGDDVWLGDINQGNVMSVRGVQSSNAGYISFGNQSSHKLGLDNSSTLTWSSTFSATGDIIAYASSDVRLKDNLVPIGNASEKVKQLTGYEFDWNDKQDVYEGHDIGVVAQEVEKVLPEIVNTRDNGYKAVKYEKLVALLIQSNKELIERVEALEKQLNAK